MANGVDVLATPQWGVRTCADFYDDGQYVGHLSPYNDAKPAIGQMIGNWFSEADRIMILALVKRSSYRFLQCGKRRLRRKQTVQVGVAGFIQFALRINQGQ